MSSAKDLVVRPINSADARQFVAKHHYSGKVVPNSQLHLGVFLEERLHGVMQFGPSIDKRRMQGLVTGSKFENFCELNRMAFDDVLPKNSESRALSIAFRMIKKNVPQIKWVVSFADGTVCGDGTIYRASGFVLTAINKNATLLRMPDGSVKANKSLNNAISKDGKYGSAIAIANGAQPLAGFQLRYVRFLDPTWLSRLSVPVIPFEEIVKAGAAMYKRTRRAESIGIDVPGDQPGEGGESPTSALHPLP